jgi:RimJ/RimL family protein N-acetyltransferase
MIAFPENLVLEDERVLLRTLKQEDLQLLLPFAEEEPELWKFSAVSAAGREGMSRYIAAAVGEMFLKKEYPLIVFDKETKAYAGSSRFYDIQLLNSTTQLGYTWYGKKFQRSGLNRHCKLLMLTYAFESWGMERVEFRADARNARSILAMKNIGCTAEGILRSNMPLSQESGRRDSIVLSILKNEWLDHIKVNLRKKIL